MGGNPTFYTAAAKKRSAILDEANKFQSLNLSADKKTCSHYFPPLPLIRSVHSACYRESKWREVEKWGHVSQQTKLSHPRYFRLQPPVLSFLSNSFTPALFPGCIPMTTGPHDKAQSGFQRKHYPYLIWKAKQMGTLEIILRGSENEDLSPAAAESRIVTVGFTVCVCAQVHRGCEALLRYVIIGYNYRLRPCYLPLCPNQGTLTHDPLALHQTWNSCQDYSLLSCKVLYIYRQPEQ